MTDLLAPPVPADCDLSGFPFMPLEVRRLTGSDQARLEKPEASWAAVLLWCEAWQQIPAASLPDNDSVLAAAAGYGRDLKAWGKIKAGALRGWKKCDDGRLYHLTVAEKALEAWLEKLAQRLSSGEGNAKRWGIAFDRAPVEQAMAEARKMLAALNPQSRSLSKKRTLGIPNTPRQDSQQESRRESQPESRRDRNRQGQGQGQGSITPIPPAGGDSDAPPATSADRWPYVQSEQWAQDLDRAGCKIGPRNWPRWQAVLADEFQGDIEALCKLAKTIDPEKAWPDHLVSEWRKRRPDAKAQAQGRKVVIL